MVHRVATRGATRRTGGVRRRVWAAGVGVIALGALSQLSGPIGAGAWGRAVETGDAVWVSAASGAAEATASAAGAAAAGDASAGVGGLGGSGGVGTAGEAFVEPDELCPADLSGVAGCSPPLSSVDPVELCPPQVELETACTPRWSVVASLLAGVVPVSVMPASVVPPAPVMPAVVPPAPVVPAELAPEPVVLAVAEPVAADHPAAPAAQD